ncbi:hypothetical protein BH09VER1_BH09VER1_08230 [soil metagenome]
MILSCDIVEGLRASGPVPSGARVPGIFAPPLRDRAFTLIELLIATAIFAILVLVLASISNHALTIWSRSESKSDLREAGRSAINLIGSELKQAVLPVYRADTNSLRMTVNPTNISSTYLNRDAIFWQAPIATSRTKGDLAIVGYFIRKDGNVSKLCRLFVNPDDPNYVGYNGPKPIDDSLLDLMAPATDAQDLQGIFLENVPGMWITAYQDANNVYTNYDSRLAQKFPARVEISLALLDRIGADRVARGAITLPPSRNYATPGAFLAALPPTIRGNVQTVTINVPFPF